MIGNAAKSRGRNGGHSARVDGRTKDLLRRVTEGEVVVIDHEDLDRVSADGLIKAQVAAVVNASPSSSGRYPNMGPSLLVKAGIPLVDGVGPLLMSKVSEGESISVRGDRIYSGENLIGVGIRQDEDSVEKIMLVAQQGLAEQFESFARNTMDYIQRERDLLFGGAGLIDLTTSIAHRHVLVVVRGYSYREDLQALRPYISEIDPVLVGVDGGADALLENGYRPDIIFGDMDSVSDEALAMARDKGGLFGRKKPVEVVLHAYPGGGAPGQERLDSLGVPYKIVEASGTSEDVAFLLAHEKRADLIVAVGSHGNLREFLDKGRAGMSSTFLVRLRVGETLMDAKGVSRLYPGRVRTRDTLLLVGSASFAMLVVILASQSLRLYFGQLFHDLFTWIGGFF